MMVKSTRILVVDDDTDMRDSVVAMLAASGMETACADSARAALAMCVGECPFDVVLSDVMMPGIDGVQFAQMLRDRHPKVRVILMTGRDSIIDSVIDAGAVPLVKPFKPQQLRRVIDDALEATRRSTVRLRPRPCAEEATRSSGTVPALIHWCSP
jgi:two-component system response regulator FlrC